MTVHSCSLTSKYQSMDWYFKSQRTANSEQFNFSKVASHPPPPPPTPGSAPELSK